MLKKCLVIAVALTLVLGVAGLSFGALVDWVDWTSATGGIPGSASGAGSSYSVTYSGQLYSSGTYTQTSGGTYYYTGPFGASPSPYTSATVPNGPTTSDVIALAGGYSVVDTITFNHAVTNPVMAIVSLGSYSVTATYDFNQPFTILSSGLGYYGIPGILTNPSDNILSGNEGAGTIQFLGTYSVISWTAPTYEVWSGFTVGVPATVPLPGALWLLGSGLVALAALRRFRKG